MVFLRFLLVFVVSKFGFWYLLTLCSLVHAENLSTQVFFGLSTIAFVIDAKQVCEEPI